ncbi:hypothetical protein SEEM1594_02669 [Salmonella enterica subsp. enterica serovar Muenchen str. baa1594]|nr:hypothetical protein SEEM1594_02669 [Salmonella enterica subsp. enterica serovar Muenchen str. baa1594]
MVSQALLSALTPEQSTRPFTVPAGQHFTLTLPPAPGIDGDRTGRHILGEISAGK